VAVDDQAHHLERTVVVVWRLAAVASLLVPVTASSLLLVLTAPAVARPVAVLGVMTLAAIVVGPLQQRRWAAWRWSVTDVALELRSGVFVRRHVAVPYFRIQQIDVIEGPLERLLELATLTVTTASCGGSVSLPGLTRARAPEIRRMLLERAAEAAATARAEGRDAV
jgi:membrane protein YdbS with pleckstrin-like domain